MSLLLLPLPEAGGGYVRLSLPKINPACLLGVWAVDPTKLSKVLYFVQVSVYRCVRMCVVVVMGIYSEQKPHLLAKKKGTLTGEQFQSKNSEGQLAETVCTGSNNHELKSI